MIEKIGHIKNPLTVIAIFAGIAEISGTIILPFIDPANQSVYIWFLMIFPFFLVGVFFATLNWNPVVLYSPSDYQDESIFLKLVRRATRDELYLKLSKEAKEVKAEFETANQKDEPASEDKISKVEVPKVDVPKDDASRADAQIPDLPEVDVPKGDAQKPSMVQDEQASYSVDAKSAKTQFVVKRLSSQVLSDLVLSEKLAIHKLSQDLGIPFESNVTVAATQSKSVTFDGFAIAQQTAHAVEVKLFPGSSIDTSRFHTSMIDASYAAINLKKQKVKGFVFHLFIVCKTSAAQSTRARAELIAFAQSIGLNVKVHIASMDDLVNEYQYNPAIDFST